MTRRLASAHALGPGDYETVGSACGFQAAIDVTDPGVPGVSQLFSAGMTDGEFQAYLDARFPLGIIPRPLDPPWVIDDADYFDGLRNQSNVSALDPAATLDMRADRREIRARRSGLGLRLSGRPVGRPLTGDFLE